MVDGGWGLGFSGSNLGFGTHCPSIYIQPFLREGGGITQYKLLMDRGLSQTCEIIEISPFYDFSHFSCGISHTTHKPLTYTDLHKVCRENIFHSFSFFPIFLSHHFILLGRISPYSVPLTTSDNVLLISSILYGLATTPLKPYSLKLATIGSLE